MRSARTPEGDGMHEPHLLPIARAARMAGMTPRTLRRRIAAGDVAAMTDPRDRRRKLIRLDDLRHYLGEVPMAHPA